MYSAIKSASLERQYQATNDHRLNIIMWNDVVAAVVWFVMAGVAIACGVGGGGIYVPLGILLLHFSPKQSSGLSQASIFGASLGGLFLNCRDTHPTAAVTITDTTQQSDTITDPDACSIEQREHENTSTRQVLYTRPLIHYDMALFLAPLEMAGGVLGVLVQTILPNWLYLFIASVVLSFVAYKTYTKFLDVHRNEVTQAAEDTDEMNKSVEEQVDSMQRDAIEFVPCIGMDCIGMPLDDNCSETEGLVTMHKVQKKQLDETASLEPDNEQDAILRKQYLKDDMRQYPAEKIIALIILWIGLFLITLVKGGKGVESLIGITCKSEWYEVLIALQFAWMLGFSLIFGLRLVTGQKNRMAVRYPCQPGDPVWNSKSLRFFGCCTFVAGIVAGLIGVGGGMVS